MVVVERLNKPSIFFETLIGIFWNQCFCVQINVIDILIYVSLNHTCFTSVAQHQHYFYWIERTERCVQLQISNTS